MQVIVWEPDETLTYSVLFELGAMVFLSVAEVGSMVFLHLWNGEVFFSSYMLDKSCHSPRARRKVEHAKKGRYRGEAC